MTYELRSDESVESGIRRVVREHVDSALEHAEQSDPETAVHEIRVLLKEIRAALKLVRGSLGETYHRENRAVRDLGRRLSGCRDSTVLFETFDAASDGLLAELDEPTGERLRAALVASGDDSRASEPTDAAVREALDATVDDLYVFVERVDDWHLTAQGFDAVGPGFTRIYRHGREGLAAALDDPTVETLHEWRKDVKHHAAHLGLLAGLWPGPMEARRDELKTLGRLLGTDHDYAVLAERLATIGVDPTALQALRLRADLQAAALPLGRRAYAEKPRAFERRIGVYWDVWIEDE